MDKYICGIYIDGDLSMRTHVQQMTSCCFAALRQLRQIRRLVSTSTFITLMVALVNQQWIMATVHWLASQHTCLVRRMQSALNAAARLIFNLRCSDHITDALVCLHWLRVSERIDYEIAVLTYRVVHGGASRYLGPFTTSQSPGSAVGCHQSLGHAICQTVNCWQPSFSGCRPRIKNSLPEHVVTAATLQSFKKT